MATRKLRPTFALIACAAIGGTSAMGQFESGVPRVPASPVSSGGNIVVSLRPATLQPPAEANADTQTPPPPTGSVKDGRGPDDEVKTAIGQAPPRAPETGAPETGRLSPIAMEGVRAPIAAADITVTEVGTKVLPDDQAAKLASAQIPLPNGSDRMLTGLTYRWQAANICHFPLYFEEPMLERNGVHRCPECIQPAVSGVKFLGNIAIYPYRATLWPAFENRYTLGHFRPGSCAPALRDTLPWSTDAALVQAGAVTGVFVGLPW